MKKPLLIILLGVMIGAAGCSGEIVATRPTDVVYDRPVSPGPDYVWIDGDWAWSGGAYIYHQGYWGQPRAGRHWETGHWQSHGSGWRWTRGHWRR
jgi:hypothetical protein